MTIHIPDDLAPRLPAHGCRKTVVRRREGSYAAIYKTVATLIEIFSNVESVNSKVTVAVPILRPSNVMDVVGGPVAGTISTIVGSLEKLLFAIGFVRVTTTCSLTGIT
jgi:hypothetical protein